MNAGQAEAFAKARAKVIELQEAYSRVFDKGRASSKDRMLVLADLEEVCNVRRTQLRPSEHETIYTMGKFAVWQRINNMRFPRPADVPAEFQVMVPRDGGTDGQDQVQRSQAGPGVAERTDD